MDLLTLGQALQQLEGRGTIQLPTVGKSLTPRELYNELALRDPAALDQYVQLQAHRLAWWHPDRPSVGGWGIQWNAGTEP